jgi:hypothetical protein
VVRYNGCTEEDSDRDGVPDEFGCSIDSDGDNINDCDDECASKPGCWLNKGCPLRELQDRFLTFLGLIATLSASILV